MPATSSLLLRQMLFFTAVVLSLGCLPASKPPTVDGPLDTNTASQLQAKVRSKHGDRYAITHLHNGEEFTANWELSNSLKKSSLLQIKPPSEWSKGDLYQALQVVLDDHESKPWYGTIDDTVLRLMRAAEEADSERASGFAPDTPYDIAVKVKKHTSEWFLEVKVQIVNEDGEVYGF